MMRYNNSLYGDSGEGSVRWRCGTRIHPDVAADLDDLATELLKRLHGSMTKESDCERSGCGDRAGDGCRDPTITQLSNNEIKALLAGEGTIQFVPLAMR